MSMGFWPAKGHDVPSALAELFPSGRIRAAAMATAEVNTRSGTLRLSHFGFGRSALASSVVHTALKPLRWLHSTPHEFPNHIFWIITRLHVTFPLDDWHLPSWCRNGRTGTRNTFRQGKRPARPALPRSAP